MYVRERMAELVKIAQPGLVVYEDYAYGKSGRGGFGATFDIGELGGVVKLLLFERGFDVLCISPTSLKSIIAGHGHAKKPEIVKQLRDRYGIQVAQHDEADAVGLLLIGEMRCASNNIPQDLRKRFASVLKLEVMKGKMQTFAIPSRFGPK